MAAYLLLVEGEADKSFFEEFCRTQGVSAGIRVAPPVEMGGKKNSKQGVFNFLAQSIEQLNDGKLHALAIVVDADRCSDGGGFKNTVRQIQEKIRTQGYDQEPKHLSTGGLLFKHNDGLPDFGVWVMPDNASEGMLEDWVLQSVSSNERDLLQQAQTTVANLSSRKFNKNKLSKAEVATWLAWQEKPGEGIYYTVSQKLLDSSSTLYLGLVTWIKTVFPT